MKQIFNFDNYIREMDKITSGEEAREFVLAFEKQERIGFGKDAAEFLRNLGIRIRNKKSIDKPQIAKLKEGGVVDLEREIGVLPNRKERRREEYERLALLKANASQKEYDALNHKYEPMIELYCEAIGRAGREVSERYYALMETDRILTEKMKEISTKERQRKFSKNDLIDLIAKEISKGSGDEINDLGLNQVRHRRI